MEFEYSGQTFEESSIIKFLEHQSSGIGVVSVGGLADRQTNRDMMKVTAAFRNFVNPPKYTVILLCKELYLIINHASVNAFTTVLYILVHVITE